MRACSICLRLIDLGVRLWGQRRGVTRFLLRGKVAVSIRIGALIDFHPITLHYCHQRTTRREVRSGLAVRILPLRNAVRPGICARVRVSVVLDAASATDLGITDEAATLVLRRQSGGSSEKGYAQAEGDPGVSHIESFQSGREWWKAFNR